MHEYLYFIFDYFTRSMLFFPLLLLCTCTNQSTHIEKRAMQKTLMDAVFWGFHTGLIKDVSGNRPASYSHCQWRSANGNFRIECTDGIITGLHCEQWYLQNMHIRFLPSTLRVIHVIKANQAYPLITRMLPRDLESFDYSRNVLHGSLDLVHLPYNLNEFHVQGNAFNGTVDIRELPQKIAKLNFAENEIQQDTLVYGMLPKNIRMILCTDNVIGRICPVEKAFSVRKSGIFVVSKGTKVY